MHTGSSSLNRYRTRAACTGGAESYPLDHQGSPSSILFCERREASASAAHPFCSCLRGRDCISFCGWSVPFIVFPLGWALLTTCSPNTKAPLFMKTALGCKLLGEDQGAQKRQGWACIFLTITHLHLCSRVILPLPTPPTPW